MGEGLQAPPKTGATPSSPSIARLEGVFPGVRTALGYRRGWLRDDLVAGLALTAILVPAAMGYAQAIGLPPITGLYASILPLVVYAVAGPSRILIVGPDSALVPLVAAAVIPLAGGDGARAATFASLLAVIAGVLILAGGVGRLGIVTDLLSVPVRRGYLNGIAALVIASQLPKIFGFSAVGQTFLDELAQWLGGVRDGRTNLAALLIGVASLGVILAIRRWRRRFPGILVAVVGATIISAVLDLQASTGLAVVGRLPQGLPGLVLPSLDPATVLGLLPAAVGIALVSATDMSVLSQAYAARGGYRVDQNRELLALGAANVASGIFGGFAVSSSSTRTPLAEAAGSRTQLTGVVAAVAIALLLLFAPGLLAAMPIAALGAVVIAAALLLVDVAAFVELWRVRRSEFALGAACFLGVAFVGVIPGIFFAVALSLMVFVRNAWQPHDAVLGRAKGVKGYHDLAYYPSARQIPGLLLYRFDAPLFFANADVFADRIRDRVARAESPVRWVVVAAEPITDVDTTAAEAIEDLRSELERQGIRLAFAELKDPVKDRLRRYGVLARIGEAYCFPTLGTAVNGYLRETGERWVDWEDEAHAGAEGVPPDATEAATSTDSDATVAGDGASAPATGDAPAGAAGDPSPVRSSGIDPDEKPS